MSFDIRQQVEELVGTFATTSLNQDSSGYSYGNSNVAGSARVQNGNVYQGTLSQSVSIPQTDDSKPHTMCLACRTYQHCQSMMMT